MAVSEKTKNPLDGSWEVKIYNNLLENWGNLFCSEGDSRRVAVKRSC
jgi:hypothetical protein